MSKIDRLSILGVRSFDNQRSETIVLQTPLTLIVGMNGSGKTTIIECLKYITTGELPPNTNKGGAFIHDPKLCGEKEVLAQIKVSFRSTEGTKMVCTRNLQLTVKKTQRSMKTLEGNLLMVRDGERMTMSSRVAEMDTMMPQYLGVSKAILDSVIFCHQEDSLWPLSEPGKLKTRFDEIFEALKYTKAIDNIKLLQKGQRDNLIKFQKDEEYSKAIKNKGVEKQKQIHRLESEIDALKVKSEEKGELIREAARKAEKAWEQAGQADLIVGQLRGKRIERDTKQESVQSLKKNLKEMSDSDDDLQRMLDQYEERVQTYEEELGSKKAQWSEIGQSIQETRSQVSAKERECGSYEAQKESHDRQVQNREKLTKETARSHNIRGFDLEVDDAQVQAFMDRISKMARDQNAAFERARRETQEELQKAQKVLNQINEQRSALNQRKENSKQTISTYDKKIGSLQQSLNNINIDEGGIAAMKSNLSETEAELESAKTDIGSSNWDSSIDNAEAENRKLDERKEKLDAELVEGTRQAGDSARLDFVRKELKAKQESLNTMTGAHGDKISSLVGQAWNPASIESDFQRIVEQRDSHVAEAERQRDGTSREMEQLNFKLNTCQNDLGQKQKALKAAEAAILKAAGCEPSGYPEKLKELEEGRDVTKADADSFSRVLEYFESCIKTAKEHNGCKTCLRQFPNAKDMEKMIKNIDNEKEKYAAGDDLKKELAEFEEDLQTAKTVSSDFDTWERLKNKEIPAVERDDKQLTEKRERLIAQLEDQDAIVSERLTAKRDVESMSKTIQTIVKYNNEISNFESQAKELLAKQNAAGLSRGLDIVQEEMKKVNDEARAVRSRLAKLTGDRERSKTQINALELERRDIRSKLSAGDYQLKERKSLEGQVEEYKVLNNEQRDTIKSIDQDLQGLGPQLSQAQAKYDDIARRGEDKDRELQAETSKLNNSLNQLQTADQEIRAYIESGGPSQLTRARREVENLKTDVTRLEQEQNRIVRDVKSLEEHLRNHSDTKRGIEDNQRYRRDVRALEAVRKEIAELEQHNAEDDKAMYDHDGHKWNMERNKLSAEQATMLGSLASKDEQLKQDVHEYDTEYKNAAKKYKEAHIKLETTKACVDDLGRYSSALDKAIMKYHSVKMEEINRIVEELWRKTYQGTDVDTIMIRSESEGANNKKSYNYRVVMVKQDTEMDMRGRCSAGQKVLASIIIRLALAECFGVNCGLIALDEPTTNLDRDNIRALAESLSEIIKLRRVQKNFQMIVITHDEEFLKAMNCSDYADVYWRVARNERQKSTIERQSIAEVL